jgi:hypothetical protein
MRSPHYCSLFPVFLEVIKISEVDRSNRVLSTATGCLYKQNETTFLITNWHVLSGRHAKTLEPLDKEHAALPDRLRVHFPKTGDIAGEPIVETYSLQDDGGTHLWLEHLQSNAVDVGALPILPPQGIATLFVNDALAAPALSPREDFFFVSQDVWVIGFPRGIRVGTLPIWKRATIASEPRYTSIADRHKILLDTATREGMSGSPVLFVSKSLTALSFDGSAQEVDLPTVKVLLGIYSGRVAGDDELAAQIGIAWNADCISEIVAEQKNYVPIVG